MYSSCRSKSAGRVEEVFSTSLVVSGILCLPSSASLSFVFCLDLKAFTVQTVRARDLIEIGEAWRLALNIEQSHFLHGAIGAYCSVAKA